MSVVLTIIIVMALIALFAILTTWFMSRVIGRGPVMADLPADEAQATLQGNRAFALNGGIDKVGFSTVKRGYSPAQVDDLLAVFSAELQRTQEELAVAKSVASESTAKSETPVEAEEFPQA